MTSLLWADLGTQDFERAWDLQKRVAAGRVARSIQHDVILLLEHPHVFTLGRRGTRDHILDPIDETGTAIPIHDINRGGDITYHGPGQLVGYLIVDIGEHPALQGDVLRWLRLIESGVIETCRALGVDAEPNAPYTGVWVKGKKLASIGVGIRNNVSMHGFAINVSTDMRYFGRIVPCGLHGVEMTSLAVLRAEAPPMARVKQAAIQAFAELLGERPEPAEDQGLVALVAQKR